MRLAAATLFLLGTSTALHAQPPKNEPLPEVASSNIGYPTVQAALAGLKAKPSAQIQVQGGWTIVADEKDPQGFALWSFTPEGHPAYPAVVKRTVVVKDGGTQIEMGVLCQATKAPCDQLVRDFIDLNERMKADINAKRGQ